jgi:hydroxymethylbilane synthase
MNLRTVRIATRKSPLALWQAHHIRTLLLQLQPTLNIELVPRITSGDKFVNNKLQELGGKGLFVKELEEALLNKEADLAVHSAKDMPAEFPEGLVLGAICKRDNPFDVLVSKEYSCLDDLPSQAVIGTGSLRRQAQLLAYRSDLRIKGLRGNINTRLAKLEQGEYQAIILAAAGLGRMGLNKDIREQLPEKMMLPACGQGALAIESRIEDKEIRSLIAKLDDPISSVCVHTERYVNALLGGNCHLPLAVFCAPTDSGHLLLQAKILNPNGSQIIQDQQIGLVHEARTLAQNCVRSLLEQGAETLLASIPK